ncbi:LacI family DNA-binding transcriptional regulator [Bifidobacterium aquikefiricola]|uniref:LacI family DNA-binding transcriptional regulator n=1 Tax=Bifidobacterium aquikefiricola TaxID=3059038 RepID=A0AB39U7N4_9BIFI
MSQHSLGDDVSIANVAAVAGVSTATVSRVLSGRRRKDDDLSRRVRAAAKQLNYSVNYAASALRSAKTNSIGLIVPELNNSLYSSLTQAIEPAVNHAGKQLILGIGSTAAEQEQRIRLVLSHRVDALIIIPVETEFIVPFLETVAKQIPVVQLLSQTYSNKLDWVGISETTVMQIIADHLSTAGARSVAYIGSSTDDLDGMTLFTAFHMQMTVSGLSTYTEWIHFTQESVDSGYRIMQKILSDHSFYPESVICSDGLTAVGVYRACAAAGLSVPEEIKIAVLHDSALCENGTFESVSFTSVQLPWDRIAAEAVTLVAAEQERKSWLPSRRELEPELIIRKSTVVSS